MAGDLPSALGQVLSSKAAYFQLRDSTCEPLIAFEIHSLARNGALGGVGCAQKSAGLRKKYVFSKQTLLCLEGLALSQTWL